MCGTDLSADSAKALKRKGGVIRARQMAVTRPGPATSPNIRRTPITVRATLGRPIEKGEEVGAMFKHASGSETVNRRESE